MLLNAQPDGTKQYIGHGLVFVDVLTGAGVRTGERFVGNSGGFKYSLSEETREKYASTGPDSSLLASGVLRRTGELELTLEEMAQRNLALALSGTELTLVQTSGSFGAGAGDPIGVAPGTVQPTLVGGNWYPLAKRNITAAGIVMKHTTIGGTTVPATDYEVDLVTGHVFIKAGGVADGKIAWLEYAYGGDTRKAVSAGDATRICYVRFLADPPSGPKIEAEWWRCQLSPSGDLNLIGDDFAQFTVKGKVLNDAINHPTQPYALIVGV
jgi:hypothetical protein